MFLRTFLLLKKKVPQGYDKLRFFKKLNNPRARKPWRDRNVEVSGRVDVTPSSDVMKESGDFDIGNLSHPSPLGLRSAHIGPQAVSSVFETGWQEKEPEKLLPSSTSTSLTSTGEIGGHSFLVQSLGAHTEAKLPKLEKGITSLPMGQSLDLNVTNVETYKEGPIPLHLQQFKRTRREAAESIILPRHINKLFHRIMGWTEDLVEIEKEKNDANENPDSPQALRKKMSNLTDKIKYGVLLDTYEKDKFAIEHQLEVAGKKFESKFFDWEGLRVLDQDTEKMDAILENKASIVMDQSIASGRVPVINRDCCPGCGALLQDKSEDDFGYVGPGEVERYLSERERKAQARHEYAQRMAELQAHWEKNGRHVGEEWLDFMTQEEFDAFYKDRNEPFVCHRCHALENLGVEGRRKVWSAPDFTDKLRTLREFKCVVVLVVDITDFPGSMVHDLPGLISMNNDVIIAINKVDCVRNRSFNYDGKDRAVAATLLTERHLKSWVTDIAIQFGLPRHQIKDVVPVSAKRGWNIEKLIASIEEASNLNLRRPTKPLKTYFVGVANVGKSSVINAISHKLYVPVPPHPQSKKVYYTKTGKDGKEAVFWRWHTPPHVNQEEMLVIPSRKDKKATKLLTVSSLPGTTVAVNAVKISLTRGKNSDGTQHEYFYDTPGLLPYWHRQSPLTLLQLRRTLIRKFRNPQCFLLLPGHTVFLGGLAAIDIVKGTPRGLLFMVYTSQKVRNAIIRTDHADEFYQEQIGKAIDPPSSLDQLQTETAGTLTLSQQKSYLFECYGKHRRRPKADIYVCGLGWVSFCVGEPCDVVLRVRTLPGVVHGVREPLRYKDLRAFNRWPRLKRRFTSKGVEDRIEGLDTDSINTVVRLTTNSDNLNPSEAPSSLNKEETLALKVVPKAFHKRYNASSSDPFEAALQDLTSTGKL